MKNGRNARLGIRFRAEQFKYEQWFANHFPDIDLLENKISPSMYRSIQDKVVLPPAFLTEEAKQHFLKAIKKFYDYLAAFSKADLTQACRQNLECSLKFLRKNMEEKDQLVILNIYTFIEADFMWLLELDSE